MLDPVVMKALEISRGLHLYGHSASIVGGAVRDFFLCRTPGDVDIATSAPLGEVRRIWPESRTIGKPGLESVALPVPGGVIDIVSHSGMDLRAELLRRDFTLNAMAVSTSGKILDPWGGMRDISQGVIRGTGNPRDRLAEDPLRAVRAARFVAELGTFRIDDDTAACCRSCAREVRRAPQERMGKEVLKAIEAAPSRFLRELENLDLTRAVLPFLGTEGDSYAHTLACCRIAESLTMDRAVRAAALFQDMGKKGFPGGSKEPCPFTGHEEAGAKLARDVMVSWAWPKGLTTDVAALVRWHGLPSRKAGPKRFLHLLSSYGVSWMDRLFLLSRADILAGSANLSLWNENRGLLLGSCSRLAGTSPPLDGRDVMKVLGIGPGPLVGEAISALAGEMGEMGPLDACRAAEWLKEWFSRRGCKGKESGDRMEDKRNL